MPIVFPIELDKQYTLQNFIKGGQRHLNCALSTMSTTAITQTNAGTIDFNTSPLFTIGTTDFNGYLVPENWVGEFRPSSITYLNSIIPSASISARVSTTGAVQALVKRRFLLPYQLPALTLGKFAIDLLSFSTSNGIDESANTGTTGNAYFRLRLRKMNNDGNTITDIVTSTQTFALDGTASSAPLFASNFSTTSTLTDGQYLVAEIELEVNQTARTAGTSIIYSALQTGVTAGFLLKLFF